MSTLKLNQILSNDLAYNEAAQKQFYSEARKALKLVAKKMGFSSDQFKISVNKGGIAVSGEVTLYHEHLMVMLSQSMGKPNCLYRYKKEMNDHTGGSNQYVNVDCLLNESTIAKFHRTIELAH